MCLVNLSLGDMKESHISLNSVSFHELLIDSNYQLKFIANFCLELAMFTFEHFKFLSIVGVMSKVVCLPMGTY